MVHHRTNLNILLLLLSVMTTIGSAMAATTIPVRFKYFNTFDGRTASMHIRSVEQAPSGLLWMGTTNGLYSFDGYDVKHYDNIDYPTGIVHSLRIVNDHIFMGCEKGLFIFDMNSHRVQLVKRLNNVNAITQYNNRLWLGTAEGVFSYSFDKKDLDTLGNINSHITPPVMSLCTNHHTLYIGTLNEFAAFDLIKRSLTDIIGDMPLVCSLLPHSDGERLWIGTGNPLYLYNPGKKMLSEEANLPVSKSMAYDNKGNLLIGSDYGLYILSGEGILGRITRDARDYHSLPSEVIWDISEDRDGNIWFATDNGVCMSPDDGGIKTYSIPSLTSSNNGNQIYCLTSTNDKTLWAGGSNGLIKLTGIGDGNPESKWYRMNDTLSYIPHNRIRKTFFDSNQRLWLATDRGLLLYNPENESFTNYLIKNNSYWIYDIGEDNDGNIWVASYSGVHCLGRDIEKWTESVAPIWSLSTKNGLNSNRVSSLCFDGHGYLWTISDRTLTKLRLKDKKVETLSLEKDGVALRPSLMAIDKEGNAWATDGYLLFKISASPQGMTAEGIFLSSSPSEEALAIAVIDNEIWVSTSGGLYMVDRKHLSKTQLNTNTRYTAITQDLKSRIWLGGDDKLVEIIDKESLLSSKKDIMITGVKVNGVSSLNDSIVAKGNIILPYDKNSLEISFSNLSFDETKFSTLMFKMKKSSEWITIGTDLNKIFMPNLPPGRYQLYISPSTLKDDSSPLLSITIQRPWYTSAFALCIYAIVGICILIWIIKFIILQQRLKTERQERTRLIEQAESKTNFLSNISHEFKTPLNIIITSLSKLMRRGLDSAEKDLLGQAKTNADKISSLLRMLGETYKEKDYFSPQILSSKFDIVELTTSIFETYREQYKEKGLSLCCTCPDSPTYIYADPFKMESIISNLLSNACKYTLSGGKVTLTVSVDLSILNIEVADTGMGISEKDIPFIFNRFFRSREAMDMEIEGSGIGLSTVKEYVDLHNGQINVISSHSGTQFTVSLPVACSPEESVYGPQDTANSIETKKESRKDDITMPLIAVIDDNQAMVDFICGLLKGKYRYVTAPDGKSGLKLCLYENPDLIITDLRMPVMDGLQMGGELRKHTSMSTVPIIMLTGEPHADTELKSLRIRIDAFIEKPFDHTLLLAKIEQLLSNHGKMKEQARIESISITDVDPGITPDEKLLRDVTNIIEQEISNPDLSVGLLSEKSGYGEKHMYRKIKLLTEMSTSEYIRSIRLRKAGIILAKGGFTVSEVMYMVGFSNASYFTRCFKKEFGCTPIDYLNQHHRQA